MRATSATDPEHSPTGSVVDPHDRRLVAQLDDRGVEAGAERGLEASCFDAVEVAGERAGASGSEGARGELEGFVELGGVEVLLLRDPAELGDARGEPGRRGPGAVDGGVVNGGVEARAQHGGEGFGVDRARAEVGVELGLAAMLTSGGVAHAELDEAEAFGAAGVPRDLERERDGAASNQAWETHDARAVLASRGAAVPELVEANVRRRMEHELGLARGRSFDERELATEAVREIAFAARRASPQG